jgi:uncharacterized protein (TIGR03382 family)
LQHGSSLLGVTALALAYARVAKCGTVGPSAWVFHAGIDGATLFMGLYAAAAVWLTRRRLAPAPVRGA